MGRESIVHPSRIRWLNAGAPVKGARYVLYWVQINQRAEMNAALDFAIEEADALDIPLVVYQGLRTDYPGASDRIHTFILEGAFDLKDALARRGIAYFFHLERRRSGARGLLAALAREAALVVTDHFPAFIIPAQARALARQIERPLAAIDASCIVPLSQFPKAEFAARTIRPKIHRALPEHLTPRGELTPRRASLDIDLPFPFARPGLEAEEQKWLDLGGTAALRRGSRRGDAAGGGGGSAKEEASRKRAPKRAAASKAVDDGDEARAERIRRWVASCDIDHSIEPSPGFRGGSRAARARLDEFVKNRLAGYPESRDDPAVDGTSNLSPYIHFGQIAAREVALAVLGAGGKGGRGGAAREKLAAAIGRALRAALAKRESAKGAFIEQLIVRRELAFNFCERNPMHASIEGLPEWALKTLGEHERDPRPYTYDAERLESGETDDDVWNAAQEELLTTGIIHNRLRMLWGKKILEWSETPSDAVRVMIDLHDRYALDGRDPNTYANILWCLGLHDRPFGPARPILGTVRPMSTDVARKKIDLDAYLARIRAASR